MWPENLAFLVMFRPNNFKQLKIDFNQYVQLSWWSRGKASDCGANCPVLESML